MFPKKMCSTKLEGMQTNIKGKRNRDPQPLKNNKPDIHKIYAFQGQMIN